MMSQAPRDQSRSPRKKRSQKRRRRRRKKRKRRDSGSESYLSVPPPRPPGAITNRSARGDSKPQEADETVPRKLATNFILTSKFMKSIPISEVKLARSKRDLRDVKDTGFSYGGSPSTMYPAQIVLRCAQDQETRHAETVVEIPAKYKAQVVKGTTPQVYLRSLPDWKYWKWTCSNHVILREWSTMVAFLQTIAAPKPDWE